MDTQSDPKTSLALKAAEPRPGHSPRAVANPRFRRQVLLFDSHNAEERITGSLIEDGWQIGRATKLDQAHILLEKRRFEVGLFIFAGECFECAQREVEHLLSLDAPRFWIALLTPQDAEDPRICRLVSQYFFDYHTLPVDPQRLITSMGHAYGMAKMHQKGRDRRPAGRINGQAIIGGSQPIQDLIYAIEKVARANAPVLITGGSGTGKELAANAIHQHSARADGPFIPVNCGALPANLIQAELFGHEKGAFTGAQYRRIGRFEVADRGTLFLDEIGDLSLELQTNLLRVLEQKTIERVGSTKQIPVDVRIIAASHKNVEQAVAKGEFREDLYYRLNVVQLALPDLKDRGSDIELLAKYFLHRFDGDAGPHDGKRFSLEALRAMNAHSWPGNVRELMNRIQRAVVMSEGRAISVHDLGLDRRVAKRSAVTLEEVRDEAERTTTIAAMKRNRNNVSQAARDLGVSRATLYRIMEKHDIRT